MCVRFVTEVILFIPTKREKYANVKWRKDLQILGGHISHPKLKSGQWNVNEDCVLVVKNTGFMPTFITSIVGVMIVWKIAQCYALNAMVMSPT